jgi:GT2 family glycosyltransferase
MKDIFELIYKNKIDYKNIIEKNISIIYNKNDFFDINIVVPVRNRVEFAYSTYNSFINSVKKTELKISYTVVEHSDIPKHSKFCKKNKINYIWIKSDENELFNKCLAQNIGAVFSVKSKYILFHDIDCLVKSDFFENLFSNIQNKKANAIQNFNDRRVLYINPELTQKILLKQFDIENLSINLPEISLPVYLGAPGGSITIDRDLFFEIGGYDPELFLANSPEDAFFWEKIDTVDKMYICDNPKIEIYHMNHPPTWMQNPHISEMEKIYKSFKDMSKDLKIKLIKNKSEIIKQFK